MLAHELGNLDYSTVLPGNNDFAVAGYSTVMAFRFTSLSDGYCGHPDMCFAYSVSVQK
jgi:hypothetical protein